MSKSITQDMAYRQSLMKYAEKYGVSRRNPTLGMVELWHRLRQRGYTHCPESLFRVMRKWDYFRLLLGGLPSQTDGVVRPPRHNGKVERSHREDQKRFYSCHAFYSLDDFAKQLAVHNRRSNNLPMRPLRWLSPNEFAVQYV